MAPKKATSDKKAKSTGDKKGAAADKSKEGITRACLSGYPINRVAHIGFRARER